MELGTDTCEMQEYFACEGREKEEKKQMCRKDLFSSDSLLSKLVCTSSAQK